MDLDDPSSQGLAPYLADRNQGLAPYLAPISRTSFLDSLPEGPLNVTPPRSLRSSLDRWNVSKILSAHYHDERTGNLYPPSFPPPIGEKRNSRAPVRLAWNSFEEAQHAMGWGAVQTFIPRAYTHRGRLWYRSNLLYFLMQPSIEMAKHVRAVRRELGLESGASSSKASTFGCVAMHIRRGDKKKDHISDQQYQKMMKQNPKEMAPDSIPLAKYVEAAKEIARANFNPRSRLRILIVTEDETAIRELTSTYPEIEWLYTTGHPRQSDDSKIANRINRGLTTGHTEMMVALINLFLSTYDCDAFVGTFSSNWSRLMYEMMTARRKGIPPPHRSLDSAWYP